MSPIRPPSDEHAMPPPIGIASLTSPRIGADATVRISAAPAQDEHGFAARQWSVQFSGSGSEYFRIWIVNLVLILVTLTLYYPWAKVRKLRYFYGNTQVAGHAFDFHGEPKRMLRGYLLVGALLAVYSLAGNLSPTGGLIALLIITPLWPLLLRASLRFRLSQTSWRGLRFHFDGDAVGAYKALLPAFVPALLVLMGAAFTEDGVPDAAARAAPNSAAGVVMMVASLGAMLCVPLMWWMLKRYQHNHYRFAGEGTQLNAGLGTFYGVFLKAALLALVAAVVTGAAVAVLSGASVAALGQRGRSTGTLMVAVMIGIMIVYTVLIAIVQPYIVSRLQNLVWSRTAGRTVRFDSTLRFKPLLWLTLKNWLLVVLTLGLYWPFAAIAMAKLKLEAVTVLADAQFDRLVSQQRGGVRDATGDVAADVFGIDVNL